jgi:hypothetical protein
MKEVFLVVEGPLDPPESGFDSNGVVSFDSADDARNYLANTESVGTFYIYRAVAIECVVGERFSYVKQKFNPIPGDGFIDDDLPF